MCGIMHKSFLILIVVLQLCEGPPPNPGGYAFYLDEESHFQGKFCQYPASVLHQICIAFGVTQGSTNYQNVGGDELKCQENFEVHIFSRSSKQYEPVKRQILLCGFLDSPDDFHQFALGRGRGTYDVAEYVQGLGDHWIANENHVDVLRRVFSS